MAKGVTDWNDVHKRERRTEEGSGKAILVQRTADTPAAR
jgi:hypothetical protein